MLNPNLREKILSTVDNERFLYDSLIGGQPVCPWPSSREKATGHEGLARWLIII